MGMDRDLALGLGIPKKSASKSFLFFLIFRVKFPNGFFLEKNSFLLSKFLMTFFKLSTGGTYFSAYFLNIFLVINWWNVLVHLFFICLVVDQWNVLFLDRNAITRIPWEGCGHFL